VTKRNWFEDIDTTDAWLEMHRRRIAARRAANTPWNEGLDIKKLPPEKAETTSNPRQLDKVA